MRLRKPLKSLYKDIRSFSFVLTSKSSIANVKWIDKITDSAIVMKNGLKISLSSRSRKAVLDAYLKYMTWNS